MTQERHEELGARIEPLRQQVEFWRKSKGINEKMPEPLWQEAIALAKVYGVSPVQRILRIDYRGLERRALGIIKPPAKPTKAPARSGFVELPVLPSARRSEQLIELEDAAGRKMTLKLTGGDPGQLLALVQAFWRPGA